ncbi:hypothetical protein BSQ39_12250 [Loigolactobacillus backii]|uniref:Uncharacterized protein n=1 Tax=Loigolactobacillus backii TaxID=375175 RepID=A0A192H0Q0_9LACO|nr:hypothetical protein [Loigolactobacillus backii]ANK58801.1 hypothetical protein AYR52_00105 [Loigolactobacillus backii]ANK61536.1 hypothetical protein AYR53_01405 [Loigolactobacillus backii]ANK63791.1 hypothetical protein AYR54_00100 [Loigolactobacillus backii]ANK66239.1 hypothetical protein AYR55_00100 [Loigolactobacillus backii]ANK69266.1 hypothetical protein AYR56_03310 [Loigolactobacillus backii]
MQLTVPNKHFFKRLKQGNVFFLKDTMVLVPYPEDYTQTLDLISLDYQIMRDELATQTDLTKVNCVYQIDPDADMAMADIKLQFVPKTAGEKEFQIEKSYHVFLDNVD